MSETPGPKASLPSMRNGRAFAVPLGNTVSRWPSSRTWSLARPRAGTVAFRKKPAVGWSVTSQAMPRASRCACRILPARSTPALSAEPESVSTSAPSRATMGSYWRVQPGQHLGFARRDRHRSSFGRWCGRWADGIMHQSPAMTRGTCPLCRRPARPAPRRAGRARLRPTCAENASNPAALGFLRFSVRAGVRLFLPAPFARQEFYPICGHEATLTCPLPLAARHAPLFGHPVRFAAHPAPNATVPKRNRSFWLQKFVANRQRDARSIRAPPTPRRFERGHGRGRAVA